MDQFAQFMDFLPWTTFSRYVQNALDLLIPEAGAIYLMDRAYVDFERLHVHHLADSFFVTRAKSNMDFHRLYFAPTDRSSGVV